MVNGRNILIVEDEDGIRAVIRNLFLIIGYADQEIVCCSNGTEAVEAVVGNSEGHFFGLVTDFQYLGGSAPAVIPVFQQKNPAAVIVGITGKDELLKEFIDLGAHHCFPKPFPVKEIMAIFKQPSF